MPILNTLPFRAWRLYFCFTYPGCRFACPGLRAPLGFQPAWDAASLALWGRYSQTEKEWGYPFFIHRTWGLEIFSNLFCLTIKMNIWTKRMHKFRIICLMIGVTRSFCPSWNRVDMESETLPRRESQYFSESTAVLRRKYSSTLGAVLEYFHRSTRVFLLEYSSIPTGVLWHPSILLPRLPFPVRKAGDDLIPCAMEYSHPIRIKSLTKPPGPTKVRKIFFK